MTIHIQRFSKRTILSVILVLALMREVRSEVYPIPGDFGWRKSVPLQLIMDDAIVADLGISDDATHKLRQLQAEIQNEIETKLLEKLPGGPFKSVNELTPQQRLSFMAQKSRVHLGVHETLHDVRNSHQEELNKLLSPEQQARLHQIQLQKARVPTNLLSDSEIAKELGLTEQQHRQIYAIHAAIQKAEKDHVKGVRRDGPSYTTLWKESPQKIMNVLTNEQREAFEKLKGKPLQAVRK